MTRGAYYSAGLHIAVIIFALLGLPSFFDDEEPEPMVLTVEILPISEMSNVPPSQKPLAPKQEKPQPKKETKPTPPTKASPPPSEKEKLVAPEEKPKPKEAEKKKPEPKKPEKKAEPKKAEEKPKEDKKEAPDLNAVLEDIRNEAMSDESDKKDVKKPTPVENKAISAPYDPSRPLSISEMDAIRGQFVRCWRVPAGAKDDYSLKVHVNVELRADGSVASAKVALGDLARYNTDQYFQAAADSAVRAVYKCSPLKNLPADKFSTWKEMELTFDPKDLLY